MNISVRPRAIVLSVGLLLLSASLASADVSPGKNVALASINQFADSYTIQATILKGKKNHVLIINSEANVFGAQAGGYCLGANLTVNGIVQLAQPTVGQGVACTQCNFNSCTVHGTYWLDIDAAEAANPGVFYNVPITVSHSGTPNNVGGISFGNAVLTATLQKK